MIIITGGAGFVGANLVARLNKRGINQIVVCDTFDTADKWLNLAGKSIADLIHPSELLTYIEDNKKLIQMIFHLGKKDNSCTNVDHLIQVNFRLSMALLQWCSKNRVRLIYTSTSDTYGHLQDRPQDGYDHPYLSSLLPLTPYAWSKHLFDQAIAALFQTSDQHYRVPPQVAGIKTFHVYGMGEGHKPLEEQSFIAQCFQQIQDTGTINLPSFTDKFLCHEQDFVHIDDCINVLEWLMDKKELSGLFNVGTGEAHSLKHVANIILNTLGKRPIDDDIQATGLVARADISSLRAKGYDSPFISCDEGVIKYTKQLYPLTKAA